MELGSWGGPWVGPGMGSIPWDELGVVSWDLCEGELAVGRA
jgi:hypothetical protein